ncbi:MAG TPA: hypothetical protein VNQ31_08015 [Sphingomonadaceae bacterium]|nr:hypothetical protein [Sphingomonadaceae bacterium]
MYNFVDQPGSRLTDGSHFLLWAMRGWALSANQSRCPTVTLAPSFAPLGMLETLNDFHELMIGCRSFGMCRLTFGALDQPRIMESEAIMLALWADVATGRIERARTVLALMIAEPYVAEVIARMARMTNHMTKLGLAPTGLRQGAQAPQPSGRPG